MNREANNVSVNLPLDALLLDVASIPRGTRLSVAFLAELAARHPRCRGVEIRHALTVHGFRATSTVTQIVSVVRFLEAEIPHLSGDSPEMENTETFLDRVDELQRTRGMSVSRAATLAAAEFHNITPEKAGETPHGRIERTDRAIIMQNVRNAKIALLAIAKVWAARGAKSSAIRATAA